MSLRMLELFGCRAQVEGLIQEGNFSHSKREERMSVDKNKCFQWGGSGGRKLRGILPDGFYFHSEVGVKLSAESENERGGDKGREQKRGLTRTSRRTTRSVGGEGWGS